MGQTIRKSGAKYVVLTTKHHDGYALWPSMEASRDYGRPWNSMEIGPKRDLVGEYTTALRKTDIKVGFYISCREWGSPLYCPELLNIYVSRHFIPQVKDLVNRYEPDILWSDGPDDYSDSIWQTKKLFQWLYSESPVKNKIVLNDRWAKFTDGKSMAIITPVNIAIAICQRINLGKNVVAWDSLSLIIK